MGPASTSLVPLQPLIAAYFSNMPQWAFSNCSKPCCTPRLCIAPCPAADPAAALNDIHNCDATRLMEYHLSCSLRCLDMSGDCELQAINFILTVMMRDKEASGTPSSLLSCTCLTTHTQHPATGQHFTPTATATATAAAAAQQVAPVTRPAAAAVASLGLGGPPL